MDTSPGMDSLIDSTITGVPSGWLSKPETDTALHDSAGTLIACLPATFTQPLQQSLFLWLFVDPESSRGPRVISNDPKTFMPKIPGHLSLRQRCSASGESQTTKIPLAGMVRPKTSTSSSIYPIYGIAAICSR